MWRNYFTVGVRALAKNKTYAFINIFGLALGLAACLMILLFVRYELSYDKALPGAAQAYQFQSFVKDPDTGEEDKMQMASYVAKDLLKKDFPQIETAVHALAAGPVILKDGQAFATEDFRFVDGNLLEILQFPLLKGDPKNALSQAGSIVLTQSEAQKYFGAEDPMGQTLTLSARGQQTDYRVTGILKDLPKNTHFAATMLARYDPKSYWADQEEFLTQWGWQSGWIYLKLRPGADANAINAQMNAFEKRNIPDIMFGGQNVNQGDFYDFRLTNIADIHLGEAQGAAMTPGNDRRSIITFAVIAALILAMACVNFTNLATARASQRAREVALRKVLGANRQQLVTQFLAESILVAGFAMLLALAFVEVALPLFAGFLDADLQMRYFGEGGLLLPILGLVLLVGAAGGVYPALYLSRFQPAKVLKANKSSAEAHGSGSLRNVLVVAQFAVSIGLIICTAVVYGQTVHARTADPGYKRDGLLQVENMGRREMFPVTETLIRELKQIDGVTAVGRSNIGIATRNSTNTGAQVPGRQEPINIGAYTVDAGFFDTMGIKLVAGRMFDESRPADDATTPFPGRPGRRARPGRARHQRGAERAGREAPRLREPATGDRQDLQDAGQSRIWRPDRLDGDRRGPGFALPLDPGADRPDHLHPHPPGPGLDADPLQHGRSQPPAPRRGSGVEADRAGRALPGRVQRGDRGRALRGEDARAQTFAGFALLAVVVACLACSASPPSRRSGAPRRSASARCWAPGARTSSACSPGSSQAGDRRQPDRLAGAWWVMRDWLNGFDTRIDLGPTPFLLAGFIALAIAIGTIAGHAMKVARSNPINALRYE
jgi:putative ABC transport system permease protein